MQGKSCGVAVIPRIWTALLGNSVSVIGICEVIVGEWVVKFLSMGSESESILPLLKPTL
jgi:hypothetical protein